MAEPSDAVLAFLVAAAIAWLLVPFTERLARRIGAIDYPNERSLHDHPTPKLSGARSATKYGDYSLVCNPGKRAPSAPNAAVDGGGNITGPDELDRLDTYAIVG